MKPTLRALLAMLLALVWSAHAQTPAKDAKRPFLWQVKSETATVYLLGSVHVAKAEMYPLSEPIEKAYESSGILVVEVNVLNAKADLAAKTIAAATYPEGETLEGNVSKETFEATSARLSRLGLPMTQFKQFKPWFIASILALSELAKLKVTPDRGIDVHFLKRATGKKEILELEGAETQFTVLNSFSDKEQELFLQYTEKDLDRLGTDLDEMMAAWSSGDAKRLEELVLRPIKENPAVAPIMKKLFDDRNKDMAAKVAGYLKTNKTYFVVVGAGHLLGENGLVSILGKQHKATQM